MSFSGFSEDDIRKLTVKNPKVNVSRNHAKKVVFKANGYAKTKNLPPPIQEELPEEAKLAMNVKKIECKTVEKLLPEEKKLRNLDEFEAKQKLIEEQNRKRKELLAKALADRTKQTQEEAQRLNEIQEEFKRLDAVLSNDVKILRKQIEMASIDYMECQKKYQKIEKEFLEVKLLMHQKLEKKEMLTEHLCTIIEKNEERKAEKLNELLQKLQVNLPAIDNSKGDDSPTENV